MRPLGRIEAAVQVGVTYQQYGQLIIDAKAVVNQAERTLRAGEMRTRHPASPWTTCNLLIEEVLSFTALWSAMWRRAGSGRSGFEVFT
jgi:hypothetical protein